MGAAALNYSRLSTDGILAKGPHPRAAGPFLRGGAEGGVQSLLAPNSCHKAHTHQGSIPKSTELLQGVRWCICFALTMKPAFWLLLCVCVAQGIWKTVWGSGFFTRISHPIPTYCSFLPCGHRRTCSLHLTQRLRKDTHCRLVSPTGATCL